MSLANRLNQIIDEQKISKREFAKRVGVSENYVYTLTGESNKITTLSPMLAKVIAMEFGLMQSGYCMGIKIKYVSKDATREGGIFFNMREHRNLGCRNQSDYHHKRQ